MSALLLESESSGSGDHIPPFTDERTPDSFGDESDWELWARELNETETLLHDGWIEKHLGSVSLIKGATVDVMPLLAREIEFWKHFPPRAV